MQILDKLQGSKFFKNFPQMIPVNCIVSITFDKLRRKLCSDLANNNGIVESSILIMVHNQDFSPISFPIFLKISSCNLIFPKFSRLLRITPSSNPLGRFLLQRNVRIIYEEIGFVMKLQGYFHKKI